MLHLLFFHSQMPTFPGQLTGRVPRQATETRKRVISTGNPGEMKLVPNGVFRLFPILDMKKNRHKGELSSVYEKILKSLSTAYHDKHQNFLVAQGRQISEY